MFRHTGASTGQCSQERPRALKNSPAALIVKFTITAKIAFAFGQVDIKEVIRIEIAGLEGDLDCLLFMQRDFLLKWAVHHRSVQALSADGCPLSTRRILWRLHKVKASREEKRPAMNRKPCDKSVTDDVLKCITSRGQNKRGKHRDRQKEKWRIIQ